MSARVHSRPRDHSTDPQKGICPPNDKNPGRRIQVDGRGSSPALVKWGGDEGWGMSSIRTYVIALASSPESASTFRFVAAERVGSCRALPVRVIRNSNRFPLMRCCMPLFKSKRHANFAKDPKKAQVRDLTRHVARPLSNMPLGYRKKGNLFHRSGTRIPHRHKKA